MALSVHLRAATAEDMAALAAIEQEAFPDPSWTAEDFLRYDCVIAEVQTAEGERRIAGFLVSRENDPGTRNTPPEREILNFAVTTDFQRLGFGRLLLKGEAKRGANLFLEVRESNTAAIQLYKNAGFKEVARRREYYDNPVESAIVMRMKW